MKHLCVKISSIRYVTKLGQGNYIQAILRLFATRKRERRGRLISRVILREGIFKLVQGLRLGRSFKFIRLKLETGEYNVSCTRSDPMKLSQVKWTHFPCSAMHLLKVMISIIFRD